MPTFSDKQLLRHAIWNTMPYLAGMCFIVFLYITLGLEASQATILVKPEALKIEIAGRTFSNTEAWVYCSLYWLIMAIPLSWIGYKNRINYAATMQERIAHELMGYKDRVPIPMPKISIIAGTIAVLMPLSIIVSAHISYNLARILLSTSFLMLIGTPLFIAMHTRNIYYALKWIRANYPDDVVYAIRFWRRVNLTAFLAIVVGIPLTIWLHWSYRI